MYAETYVWRCPYISSLERHTISDLNADAPSRRLMYSLDLRPGSGDRPDWCIYVNTFEIRLESRYLCPVQAILIDPYLTRQRQVYSITLGQRYVYSIARVRARKYGLFQRYRIEDEQGVHPRFLRCV